jgi:mannose-6-phosphate isomerase-like protein (cupin superfamily)
LILTTGYVQHPGQGDHIWFFNSLMTVKADHSATHGGFTLIEQLTPTDFAAPPHIHDAEEEAFYVLEGSLDVTCGDRQWSAGVGSFVLLPRGIPHAFRVTSPGGARLLQITAPASFEQFAAEAGEPAPAATLPPPAEPDVPRLLAAMSRHAKRLA